MQHQEYTAKAQERKETPRQTLIDATAWYVLAGADYYEGKQDIKTALFEVALNLGNYRHPQVKTYYLGLSPLGHTRLINAVARDLKEKARAMGYQGLVSEHD